MRFWLLWATTQPGGVSGGGDRRRLRDCDMDGEKSKERSRHRTSIRSHFSENVQGAGHVEGSIVHCCPNRECKSPTPWNPVCDARTPQTAQLSLPDRLTAAEMLG